MTLSKQIAFTIAFLFILTFLGVSFINIKHVRQYLESELTLHAQDTAATLATSLAPDLAKKNYFAINRTLDKVFNRGYYLEIGVTSNSGQTIAMRSRNGKAREIPAWFAKMVQLQAPRAKATTSSGAMVYVQGDTNRAYNALWTNSLDEMLWLILVAGAMTLIGISATHFLLGALRRVEDQAIAIIAHERPAKTKLPRARELRQLVNAMNKVSERAVAMFGEQADLTEKLRAQSFRDPLTGLGNRRYFNAQLEEMIRSLEEFYFGALLLINLRHFQQYNDKMGLVAGDELLRQVAELLQDMTAAFKGSLLAHFSGAHFALLLPGARASEAEKIAEKIVDALAHLFPEGIHSGETGHVGVSIFKKGMSSTELFSAADMALGAAQAEGPIGWKRHEGASRRPEARGCEYWRNLFIRTIEEKDILLQYQCVYEIISEKTIQHEVFLRIRDDNGEIIPAGVFMPIAQSHGFAPELDRIAIEKLLTIVKETENNFACNLSISAALDQEFVLWLEGELAGLGKHARRISFEFREYDLVRHLDAVRELSKKLSPFGTGLGVDHSGHGFASFGYLGTLKMDYLKIDGGLVRGIDKARDNQFLVQSIARIAHELDIRVVAESVETPDERAALSLLYLDALQGYLIGIPADSF